MKIGLVVLAENILIEFALHVHVVVQYISSNISVCIGPIFVIFSPYESALRADDGSVPYFPICQGTLPWQPNNVAVMKANWYYVHSLHVRQMVADFVSLLFARGDTAVPSGLLARLCHAFPVCLFFPSWEKLSGGQLCVWSRIAYGPADATDSHAHCLLLQ